MERKKNSFKNRTIPKRLSSKNISHNIKTKYSIIFLTTATVLISLFAFIPRGTDPYFDVADINSSGSLVPNSTPKTNPTKLPDGTSSITDPSSQGSKEHTPIKTAGLIESSQAINSAVWQKIAENAWRYFQPGVGVHPNTGLPGAGIGYPYFTDWDLGVYVQAVIDAERIGLINKEGEWGSIARLDKVLKFLENRELNETTRYPFWFYQAGNGGNYREMSDKAIYSFDGVDAGRLLVALSNLRAYQTVWTNRINDFVTNIYGNRTNYVDLVSAINNESTYSTSMYAYYVASGFASFFPELSSAPDSILNNIDRVGTVTTYNVTLPKAEILSEPLLHSVFELKNNSRIWDLSRKVYLAHESRFNDTGVYAAFSEGNSGLHGIFIYEWVVLSNDTWKVTKIDRSDFPINPIVYTKVALSFLALYNTTYARDLAIYLERCVPASSNGYNDGADFTYDAASRNVASQIGSNTNGLILSASRFALLG